MATPPAPINPVLHLQTDGPPQPLSLSKALNLLSQLDALLATEAMAVGSWRTFLNRMALLFQTDIAWLAVGELALSSRPLAVKPWELLGAHPEPLALPDLTASAALNVPAAAALRSAMLQAVYTVPCGAGHLALAFRHPRTLTGDEAALLHHIAALCAQRLARDEAADQAQRALAAALHDGLLQDLYAWEMGLDNCLAGEPPPPRLAACLRRVRGAILSRIAEVRSHIWERQPAPEPTLGASIRQLGQVLTMRGWQLHLTVEGATEAPVSPRQWELIMPLIREGLINSAKHAPGSPVTVTLDASPDRFLITVADSGPGCGGGGTTQGAGMHLMRQRTTLLQGTMSIMTALGQGTTLVFHLPPLEGL